MLKNKKVVVIFAFILIIALALVFNSAAGVFKKPVVLEFGIFAGSNWNVPDYQSYTMYDDAIARFEQLHPDVKIKYRSGTLKSDYSEWLAERIVKGAEPDVFCVPSGDFNTFATIGVMKNLDKFIKNDSKFKINLMYNSAVRSGQLHGSQYALPFEVVPVLMFVNKTLLKSEGIDIPKSDWTWNDFYKICKRVTRSTSRNGKIDQFGEYGFTWQHAVYTNGQPLFDSDGSKASFNSPGALEAVNFMLSLNQLNMNYKATSDDFDNGKVAFRPFLLSAYRVYKPYPYKIKKYSQFEWDCIKLPRGPNGKNTSELYSSLMGISSKAKHEKEAWEFLKFLTYDRTTQMNVLKYSQGVSVLRDVTESKEASEELLKDNLGNENIINMKLLSEVIEQSTVTPKFQKYDEAMSMADKELYQVINGEKNPGNALASLDRELNKFLIQ